MEEFNKLFLLLKGACEKCVSNTIALSGGLDSTIIAYYLKEKNPKAVAIISKDFVASDLVYCQRVAMDFGIDLTINYADTSNILNAIDGTIRILKNFNDIEIRNNVVMYLALQWAKENDINGVITGDGADELFAGYNFLVKKPAKVLDGEIKRVVSIMHFPSQKIAEFFKIKLESPFLDQEIINFANQIPTELKVKVEGQKRYGKWILRKIFEDKMPKSIVWREKTPMQDGAGTQDLTNLFNSVISDEVFSAKKKKIQESDGVVVRSKESLHYYQIYKNHFGKPVKDENGYGCPFCGFTVGCSKFCRMCGAFPI